MKLCMRRLRGSHPWSFAIGSLNSRDSALFPQFSSCIFFYHFFRRNFFTIQFKFRASLIIPYCFSISSVRALNLFLCSRLANFYLPLFFFFQFPFKSFNLSFCFLWIFVFPHNFSKTLNFFFFQFSRRRADKFVRSLVYPWMFFFCF